MVQFSGAFNILKPRSITILAQGTFPGAGFAAFLEAIVLTQTPGLTEFNPRAFRADLIQSQTHSEEVAVTTHPVQQFNRTDHARRMPDVLEFDGQISDTPLPGAPGFVRLGIAAARRGGADLDTSRLRPAAQAGTPVAQQILRRAQDKLQGRSKFHLDKLRTILAKRELVSVATSTKFYSSMLITRLSWTRDNTSGGAIDISVSMREIQIARSALLSELAPNGDALDAGAGGTVQGGSLAGTVAG